MCHLTTSNRKSKAPVNSCFFHLSSVKFDWQRPINCSDMQVRLIPTVGTMHMIFFSAVHLESDLSVLHARTPIVSAQRSRISVSLLFSHITQDIVFSLIQMYIIVIMVFLESTENCSCSLKMWAKVTQSPSRACISVLDCQIDLG